MGGQMGAGNMTNACETALAVAGKSCHTPASLGLGMVFCAALWPLAMAYRWAARKRDQVL